jgi:hypothetical protein
MFDFYTIGIDFIERAYVDGAGWRYLYLTV